MPLLKRILFSGKKIWVGILSFLLDVLVTLRPDNNKPNNMDRLKEGDKAPDFTALNQDGKEVSLKDFRGKKVILYFYPKDDTPGCTAEACNLRDNMDKLRKEGYEVLGISKDEVKSHGKFAKKYDLPFDILADPEKEIQNAFGVWGEKKFMGRTFMGTHRVTFIIDEKGIIERVIEKVKTKDHTKQILGK